MHSTALKAPLTAITELIKIQKCPCLYCSPFSCLCDSSLSYFFKGDGSGFRVIETALLQNSYSLNSVWSKPNEILLAYPPTFFCVAYVSVAFENSSQIPKYPSSVLYGRSSTKLGVRWGRAKEAWLFERRPWTHSNNKEHSPIMHCFSSDPIRHWCHWTSA